MEKFGGRKFVLTLILIISGVLVDIFSSKGISQELVALFVGIMTVYGASNAAISMKALKVESSGSQAETAAPVDNSAQVAEISQQLQQLGHAVESIGLSSTNTNKLLIAALKQTT